MSDRAGIKYDDGKPDWSLLPMDEVEDVVRVLTHSKLHKYRRDNWKGVDSAMHRYYSSAMRHLVQWKKYAETGEEEYRLDSETKLPHLAHVVCCLLFLMWFDKNNTYRFVDSDDIPRWLLFDKSKQETISLKEDIDGE